MRKVLFLDRDGVLIKEFGSYNYLPEHVVIVEGIVDALARASAAGFEFVIITNQGGIAKGLYDHWHVYEIHRLIEAHFKQHGISFLDWFYCPHHDVSGRCLCRKPGSIMLEKAIARYNVNPEKSFFFGDKESDYEAGVKAGVHPVQINSNENLNRYLDAMLP